MNENLQRNYLIWMKIKYRIHWKYILHKCSSGWTDSGALTFQSDEPHRDLGADNQPVSAKSFPQNCPFQGSPPVLSLSAGWGCRCPELRCALSALPPLPMPPLGVQPRDSETTAFSTYRRTPIYRTRYSRFRQKSTRGRRRKGRNRTPVFLCS